MCTASNGFIDIFQSFPYASDIGGMLGLWIGLSSLGAVQLAEFIIECLAIKVRKLKQLRSVSPTENKDA
jgi:hypothetical protein